MRARFRDRWARLLARLTADAGARRTLVLATAMGSTLVALGLAWWVQRPLASRAPAALGTAEEPATRARDDAGRPLTAGWAADETAAGQGLAIDYQRRVERLAEERIESLLAPVVGAGKAVARVAATIDFSRTERTEERVDPERTAIRKSHASREGAPGTRGASAKGATRGTGEATGGHTERRDESQEYEVSKTTSRTVAPMGAVTQLSVAVLIDGTYRQEGAARVFVPRTTAELETLKTLVSSAVGISEARGDRLEVTSVPFQVPEADPAAGALARPSEWAPALALRLLGIAIVLGALVLVVRPLVGALVGPSGGASLRGGGVVVEEVAPTDLARENLLLAQQHPERAAQLVRQWLIESQQRTG